MTVDVAMLTRTVRRNQIQQLTDLIRQKRTEVATKLANGRLRHADLEEALQAQGRDLDAMAGALQAYDNLLAELEGEGRAPAPSS